MSRGYGGTLRLQGGCVGTWGCQGDAGYLKISGGMLRYLRMSWGDVGELKDVRGDAGVLGIVKGMRRYLGCGDT